MAKPKKKSNEIPLPVLKKRLDRLGAIVAKREKAAKGKKR